MSVSTSYAFNNDDVEAIDRHQHLSALLDDFTFARLSRVGDLAGQRCLEVGAGGGSVARWLADRAGPTGRVLATDLNTSRLPADAGFEVLEHNLVTEPVPDGPWDLIHARLVLIHIPERREVVRRLAAALAPGGALVIEDWDVQLGKFVLDAPSPEAAALFETYQATLSRLMVARGSDQGWGSKIHGVLRAEGLEVDTEMHARAWPGGTAGALIIRANMAQLREEFVAAGFTEERMDEVYRLVGDPRFVLRGMIMFSGIGRRPVPGEPPA